MSEHDANVCAESVRRGGSMVMARVNDAQLASAQSIMKRYAPVNPQVRVAEYQKTGSNTQF